MPLQTSRSNKSRSSSAPWSLNTSHSSLGLECETDEVSERLAALWRRRIRTSPRGSELFVLLKPDCTNSSSAHADRASSPRAANPAVEGTCAATDSRANRERACRDTQTRPHGPERGETAEIPKAQYFDKVMDVTNAQKTKFLRSRRPVSKSHQSQCGSRRTRAGSSACLIPTIHPCLVRQEGCGWLKQQILFHHFFVFLLGCLSTSVCLNMNNFSPNLDPDSDL